MPGIFPATWNGAGQCFVFPDVCMTPGVLAGAPGPIPYPNIVMLSDFSGSKKVKIKKKQTLRKGDTSSRSSGDEPGNSPGGVMSGVNMSKAEIMSGCSKVKVEGKKVGHLLSLVGHNGPGGKNNPAGMVLAVGQTNVLVIP